MSTKPDLPTNRSLVNNSWLLHGLLQFATALFNSTKTSLVSSFDEDSIQEVFINSVLVIHSLMKNISLKYLR